MLRRAWAAYTTIALLPFYPAVVAHECIHALAARPWASRVELRLSIHERPEALLWYPDETPPWAIALANLAPFLTGLALLPVAIYTIRWLGPMSPAAIYVTLLWAAVGIPSRADLRPTIVLLTAQKSVAERPKA